MVVDGVVGKALKFGFGGMTPEELLFLQETCRDKKVLELGSHIGQSSYIIASVAKSLTCVDAWIDNCPYLDKAQREIYVNQSGGMEKQFDENTKDFSNVTKIKAFTKDAVGVTDDDYDIIFIDCDHSYEGVKKDIENYKDKGAQLLFHDYGGGWTGVKKAVDEQKFKVIRIVNYLILVIKND